eukprot:6400029-Prymnesium_polylepis.1
MEALERRCAASGPEEQQQEQQQEQLLAAIERVDQVCSCPRREVAQPGPHVTSPRLGPAAQPSAITTSRFTPARLTIATDQVLAERTALFTKLRERMPYLKQKVAGQANLTP